MKYIVERFRSLGQNLDTAAKAFETLGDPDLGTLILTIARMDDCNCYKNLLAARDKWFEAMEECEHCFSLVWLRFVEDLMKERVRA